MTRYKRRDRDFDYMTRVKLLPCCAAPGTPGHVEGHKCAGRIEADHAGKKMAAFHKCDDRMTIPLCKLAHDQRDHFHGPWSGWDRTRMRAWLDERIAETARILDANAMPGWF